jgi:hypothetical protein
MQPIKPRKPKRADATLAAVRERIRLAEKAQAPIAREMVALDRASFELLASCVEGGLGKKPAVLMQALAIGLQALSGTIGAGAHDNGRGADLPPPARGGDVVDLFPRERKTAVGEDALEGIAASVTGGAVPFKRAPEVIVPPSQRRHDDGDDVPDEDEPDVD